MRSLFVRKACVLWAAVFGCTAASFGQYYFGRNKVQYNPFEWHVLQTEHFDIYYYPEMEELARIGAAWAEESYVGMQDRFNFVISRRIPLIFYSSHFHFEETNTYPYLISPGLGGFFEFIKGRVVVPSDGDLSRFRHTIRHEIVHVFQTVYCNRVYRDHASTQAAAVPLWFVEGLAEYWSEDWGTEAEMVIRDAVLNDALVPIPRMSAILGTYMMYKEGQSILRFIAGTWGEYRIVRIMDNLWGADTFSRVLKITLGKDEKELDEAWRDDLKKRLFPIVSTHDFPRNFGRMVTKKGYNALPAFCRLDGKPSIVFLANRDGYSSLYRKFLLDEKEESLRILVRGEKAPEAESFHMQDSRIDVHADRLLAYSAKSGPQDFLCVYSLTGDTLASRTAHPDLVSLFSPSWSPDGSCIALTGLDRSGRRDLYLFRPGSGAWERLTCDYFDDLDPDWSPDGTALVFSSDRTGTGAEGYKNLFLYDLSSGIIRYLTFGPWNDASPCWSPDGKVILFSSDRGGVPDLWAVQFPSAGSPLRFSAVADSAVPPAERALLKQVSRMTGGAFSPDWTDSSGLVFTAFDRSGFQIGYREANSLALDSLQTAPPDSFGDHPRAWSMNVLKTGGTVKGLRYRRKFSLDIAQSQVSQDPIYGTSGGGQLSISDLLGNEQYFFLVFNNARTRSDFWDGFNLAVSRIDLSGRLNTALGLYRLAGHYFNYYEGYFTERRYGGFGSVSYPLNLFERLETSLNIRHSDKYRWGADETRKALLVSNFFSYVKDNSLWGPSGPLDGLRFSATLGNTVDLRYSNVNFTTVMLDFRKYFRLGYRVCHAVRVWTEFNHGKEPLPFYMGGSWDLRGYKLWSLWGPKLVLVSNELRFPFLDQFYLGFPFGGVGFSSIRGALFLDAGNVWDGPLTDLFQDLKGSFGFGIRFRVAGYLVLRFDIGKRTDFKSIEPRTFRQFFFGWDF